MDSFNSCMWTTHKNELGPRRNKRIPRSLIYPINSVYFIVLFSNDTIAKPRMPIGPRADSSDI